MNLWTGFVLFHRFITQIFMEPLTDGHFQGVVPNKLHLEDVLILIKYRNNRYYGSIKIMLQN